MHILGNNRLQVNPQSISHYPEIQVLNFNYEQIW